MNKKGYKGLWSEYLELDKQYEQYNSVYERIWAATCFFHKYMSKYTETKNYDTREWERYLKIRRILSYGRDYFYKQKAIIIENKLELLEEMNKELER